MCSSLGTSVLNCGLPECSTRPKEVWQLCLMIRFTWNTCENTDPLHPESPEEWLGAPSSTGGFMIRQVWETWPITIL